MAIPSAMSTNPVIATNSDSARATPSRRRSFLLRGAFRLMDVRLVRAGADQNGIHQAEQRSATAGNWHPDIKRQKTVTSAGHALPG
jgi:hypothetical protein